MRSRALATVAACAVLLWACAPDEPRLLRQRWLAMATWVDVEVQAGPVDAAGVLSALEAWLHVFERDYYAWAADGELARLNAALARGESARVSPRMAALLRRSQALALQSGGWFDPGIGALVQLWGFHAPVERSWRPPAVDAIEARLAGSGIRRLELSGHRVSSDSRTVVIDLGGVAKGYAVDHMVSTLRAHGLAAGLVNAGGDLRVFGLRAGRPWRIGIRDPRAASTLAVLRLADGEAAFTSGDYERYADTGDGRSHHLLDPHTGQPARHTRSVTVVAADGVTADAAATAIFVAGPLQWRRVARALGVAAVLRVDARGNVEMTEAMRDRIETAPATGSAILQPARAETRP